VSPESVRGGAIAAVRDGERVTIDIDERVLHVDVPDAELARRLAAYEPPPPAFTRGVLGRYCTLVGSASNGATLP
jgi:dihydroxy-acid dehydratase